MNHQNGLQHVLGKVVLPWLLEHPHRSEGGQRGQPAQASHNKAVGHSLSVGLRDSWCWGVAASSEHGDNEVWGRCSLIALFALGFLMFVWLTLLRATGKAISLCIQSQVPKPTRTKDVEYGSLPCWTEVKIPENKLLPARDCRVSSFGTFYCWRTAGDSKSYPTSPNLSCGIINYAEIHFFFWGSWQLWRVGSSWHSMRPNFQPCWGSHGAAHHCSPWLSWDFAGSLPYAFSSSITSVFICSHLVLVFSIQMARMEDSLEWLTAAKLPIIIYICLVIPKHKHFT